MAVQQPPQRGGVRIAGAVGIRGRDRRGHDGKDHPGTVYKLSLSAGTSPCQPHTACRGCNCRDAWRLRRENHRRARARKCGKRVSQRRVNTTSGGARIRRQRNRPLPKAKAGGHRRAGPCKCGALEFRPGTVASDARRQCRLQPQLQRMPATAGTPALYTRSTTCRHLGSEAKNIRP